MESAKIPHHHHHHQQQLALPLHQEHHQLLPSSTNLDQYYAAPTSHAWTSNSTRTILNTTNGRFGLDESYDIPPPQDLSFNWGVGNINYTMNPSVHEVVPQICRLKQQLSNSCPNLGEMISSPSSSIEETSSYGKNDPNVNLLLSTLSSSACPEEFIYGGATAKRGSFSQIYPTINVSNFSTSHESSFDVNSRALDLLNSSYGYDYVKPSIQRSLESARNTMMPFGNGGTGGEEKSCNVNCSEGKAPQQKKSRLESGRPSCQPFKVRKEKLGDRIAALQQMVAPFGKTDTASVLMEAIGYIKFLQNQVETLSLPYLKSSSRNNARAMHGGAVEEVQENEERRRDLRSRGLCLVPMSCLSYMTDSGGSVWPPPPNFGGGT